MDSKSTTKKRRSSILKIPNSPWENDENQATETKKSRRSSRRVSFASTHHVKLFPGNDALMPLSVNNVPAPEEGLEQKLLNIFEKKSSDNNPAFSVDDSPFCSTTPNLYCDEQILGGSRKPLMESQLYSNEDVFQTNNLNVTMHLKENMDMTCVVNKSFNDGGLSYGNRTIIESEDIEETCKFDRSNMKFMHRSRSNATIVEPISMEETIFNNSLDVSSESDYRHTDVSDKENCMTNVAVYPKVFNATIVKSEGMEETLCCDTTKNDFNTSPIKESNDNCEQDLKETSTHADKDINMCKFNQTNLEPEAMDETIFNLINDKKMNPSNEILIRQPDSNNLMESKCNTNRESDDKLVESDFRINYHSHEQFKEMAKDKNSSEVGVGIGTVNSLITEFENELIAAKNDGLVNANKAIDESFQSKTDDLNKTKFDDQNIEETCVAPTISNNDLNKENNLKFDDTLKISNEIETLPELSQQIGMNKNEDDEDEDDKKFKALKLGELELRFEDDDFNHDKIMKDPSEFTVLNGLKDKTLCFDNTIKFSPNLCSTKVVSKQIRDQLYNTNESVIDFSRADHGNSVLLSESAVSKKITPIDVEAKINVTSDFNNVALNIQKPQGKEITSFLKMELPSEKQLAPVTCAAENCVEENDSIINVNSTKVVSKQIRDQLFNTNESIIDFSRTDHGNSVLLSESTVSKKITNTKKITSINDEAKINVASGFNNMALNMQKPQGKEITSFLNMELPSEKQLASFTCAAENYVEENDSIINVNKDCEFDYPADDANKSRARSNGNLSFDKSNFKIDDENFVLRDFEETYNANDVLSDSQLQTKLFGNLDFNTPQKSQVLEKTSPAPFVVAAFSTSPKEDSFNAEIINQLPNISNQKFDEDKVISFNQSIEAMVLDHQSNISDIPAVECNFTKSLLNVTEDLQNVTCPNIDKLIMPTITEQELSVYKEPTNLEESEGNMLSIGLEQEPIENITMNEMEDDCALDQSNCSNLKENTPVEEELPVNEVSPSDLPQNTSTCDSEVAELNEMKFKIDRLRVELSQYHEVLKGSISERDKLNIELETHSKKNSKWEKIFNLKSDVNELRTNSKILKMKIQNISNSIDQTKKVLEWNSSNFNSKSVMFDFFFKNIQLIICYNSLVQDQAGNNDYLLSEIESVEMTYNESDTKKPWNQYGIDLFKSCVELIDFNQFHKTTLTFELLHELSLIAVRAKLLCRELRYIAMTNLISVDVSRFKVNFFSINKHQMFNVTFDVDYTSYPAVKPICGFEKLIGDINFETISNVICNVHPGPFYIRRCYEAIQKFLK